uniref:Uncharacterized protein n=1 Tax=Arundo donax TaxID=35708 RepID=A0A0A9H4T9_ARUDO
MFLNSVYVSVMFGVVLLL